MDIPKKTYFPAFSMIVDVNSFTRLVAENDLGVGVAQYVRDILTGPIVAIEKAGGSVIGVMGDAIFGILPDADSAADACREVARDLNLMCEYLDGTEFLEGVPHPPTLKIGVEYGWLTNSTVTTSALGEIPFCIGPATNYVSRIIAAGEGNRCHVGPAAYAAGMDRWIGDEEVREVAGKKGEPIYRYYKYDLGEIWREGHNDEGEFHW
jgi:class 3 adenylate cyclase